MKLNYINFKVKNRLTREITQCGITRELLEDALFIPPIVLDNDITLVIEPVWIDDDE